MKALVVLDYKLRIDGRTVADVELKRGREALGEPTSARSAVFLNIVQKTLGPPPPRFEHHVANFF